MSSTLFELDILAKGLLFFGNRSAPLRSPFYASKKTVLFDDRGLFTLSRVGQLRRRVGSKIFVVFFLFEGTNRSRCPLYSRFLRHECYTREQFDIEGKNCWFRRCDASMYGLFRARYVQIIFYDEFQSLENSTILIIDRAYTMYLNSWC